MKLGTAKSKQVVAKPVEVIKGWPWISQSSITTWMSCPERARLSKEGWRGVRPSMPLTFGTVFHHVLEKAYKEGAAPSPGTIKQILLQSRADAGVDRLSAEQVQTMEDAIEIINGMAPAYFKKYMKDFEDKWSHVEAEFKIPLPKHECYMYGFYDRVRHRKGKMQIFDTKTKSKIEEENLTETLHFDFQFMYEMLALYKETGQVSTGAIMDIIRRPGLRKKVGEGAEEFIARINEDVLARPDHYFIRLEVAIGKDELMDFEKQLDVILPEYLKFLRKEGPVYRNTMSCTGKWTCDFLAICARGDYSMHKKIEKRGR